MPIYDIGKYSRLSRPFYSDIPDKFKELNQIIFQPKNILDTNINKMYNIKKEITRGVMSMFTWLGLLEASAVGGICIFLFFLISLMLGERYWAGYKKIIWLLIALRMCIPVSVSFFPKPVSLQVPVYVLGESRQAAKNGTGYGLEEASGEGTSATAVSAINDPGGNMGEQIFIRGQVTSQSLLVRLWGAGTVTVLLFSLSAHVLFLRKMAQRSRVCAEERILKMAAEAAGEMGLKRVPEIRLMQDTQTGPFTAGFRRNVIFLPDRDYQEKDLQYIIRHELAHCAGRDTQIKMLFVIVRAVHWFNPFVWCMKSLADQDMELACDEKVLAGASREERGEYGEVLMSCIRTGKSQGSVLATGYVQGVKFMKKRFRNIFNMQKKSGKAAAGIMIVLLVMVSAGIGFKAGRTVYAQGGIAIETGRELLVDVTGDGRTDRIRVFDNNDALRTSLGLTDASGIEAWFEYEEELWAASELTSGDLSGNGAADIVLMRYSNGMHGTGFVSVLYVEEESGSLLWREYSGVFVQNPAIEWEQPKTFEDLECRGASVIEKDGKHYLRLLALDMAYFAETGDDIQELYIDCSWQGDGWLIEEMSGGGWRG